MAAENKTRPTAVPVEQFLDGVTPELRREDAKALCAMMARLSGETPTMWGPTIIGFGARRYRTDAGREGDILKVGFSPRKPAMVLYLGGFEGRADMLGRLGKVSTGKSCIYVKRLADLDQGVLEEMIVRSLER